MNKKINTDNITEMINADKKTNLHGSQKLIFADITYKVRGAIFVVYNELGFGHKEQVYQKALAEEFESTGIPYKREKNLDVKFKNSIVGNYRPDFVVNEKIVMEIKAVEFMPKNYETQLINYLKTTDYYLGLLVNFGAPRLYIKRLVWTGNPRKSATNLRKSFNHDSR